MQKKLSYIFKYPLLIIMTTMIITVLGAYIIKQDTLFSDYENRYLKTRPSITVSGLLSGDFMSEFEDYTKEQLPLRDVFIRAKAVSEMLLFKCENNGIIRGKDDFLFEKTIGVSDQLSKNIAAIKVFCNSYDRNINIAVAPTSVYAYADKLPLAAPVLDEDRAFRELTDNLSGVNNANIIDINSVIGESVANNNSALYYRTDHHWTTQGAYMAYKGIVKALNVPSLDLNELQSHSIDDFYGTSYAKYKGMGIAADSIIYYDIPIESYEADGEEHSGLMDYDKFDSYDKYAAFMYGNPASARIKSHIAGNGRSLLVFKDSYANSVLPYLACSYDDIMVMDLRYLKEPVSTVMEANQDADVLLLYNWSFMNEDNHFYKLAQ